MLLSLHDEFELIRSIKKTVGSNSKRVCLPIGDDAAVAESPKGKLVATIDTMVEGVHFDLTYTTPRELGHKALAVSLSDIAAMGATPLYALVSIGLKQELQEYFVTELYEGMKALSKKYGVDIIGGNTVQAPQAILVDVALVGQVGKTFFTRSGAKFGDCLAVTGSLGTSAAGLSCLKLLGRQETNHHPELLRAHLMPEPRIRESLALQAAGGVTSMIDISDGLAREIHHLADNSKVGMWLDEEKLPVSLETHRAGTLVGMDPFRWVLYGGEDYELLFTFSPKKLQAIQKSFRRLKTAFTVIGSVTERKSGVKMRTRAGAEVKLEPSGWNHFVRRKKPSAVAVT